MGKLCPFTSSILITHTCNDSISGCKSQWFYVIKFNFTLFCRCEIFKMNEGEIGKVGAAICIPNVDGLSLLMKKR